ncbi:helix-turn-helix domain-containing protein [Colwellia piezophila]|uniref:helix-turn-helix domain-containing protein n=1 Tax=Colwellia piezophila TaxID=211668 RepID=UPI00036FF3B7|nr:helix-turn-helix transcriptional regulator [Colwellia piezophila]
MDVNARKIKALRTSNGWTQQHLADVCAISLRTVQRVERYGNASQETLASFASVFELAQAELIVAEQQVEQVSAIANINQSQALVVAALFGACVGALIMYVVG